LQVGVWGGHARPGRGHHPTVDLDPVPVRVAEVEGVAPATADETRLASLRRFLVSEGARQHNGCITQRTSNSYRRTTQKFGFTGTWPPHALVILFDSAFPRQRCKSPREQRFAAVVSDGDYLLQPEPLVLAARVEQMNWDHHSDVAAGLDHVA